MRLGFVIMALLAALVALYSFRFFGVLDGVWVNVDPGIRDVIVADPVGALAHAGALRNAPESFADSGVHEVDVQIFASREDVLERVRKFGHRQPRS